MDLEIKGHVAVVTGGQTRIMWHISSEGEIPTPLRTKRGLNTIGLDRDQAKAATAAIYNDY